MNSCFKKENSDKTQNSSFVKSQAHVFFTNVLFLRLNSLIDQKSWIIWCKRRQWGLCHWDMAICAACDKKWCETVYCQVLVNRPKTNFFKRKKKGRVYMLIVGLARYPSVLKSKKKVMFLKILFFCLPVIVFSFNFRNQSMFQKPQWNTKTKVVKDFLSFQPVKQVPEQESASDRLCRRKCKLLLLLHSPVLQLHSRIMHSCLHLKHFK